MQYCQAAYGIQNINEYKITIDIKTRPKEYQRETYNKIIYFPFHFGTHIFYNGCLYRPELCTIKAKCKAACFLFGQCYMPFAPHLPPHLWIYVNNHIIKRYTGTDYLISNNLMGYLCMS